MVFDKAVDEDLQESKVNVIRNLRKEYPCYVETETLATLSHGVIWKVENVPNKLADLTKEIFNQSVESATWFFLLLIVKHEK